MNAKVKAGQMSIRLAEFSDWYDTQITLRFSLSNTVSPLSLPAASWITVAPTHPSPYLLLSIHITTHPYPSITPPHTPPPPNTHNPLPSSDPLPLLIHPKQQKLRSAISPPQIQYPPVDAIRKKQFPDARSRVPKPPHSNHEELLSGSFEQVRWR